MSARYVNGSYFGRQKGHSTFQLFRLRGRGRRGKKREDEETVDDPSWPNIIFGRRTDKAGDG